MSGLESLLSGRVLGDRYRIEEVIGRGGMGAVYRAMDERLGRQVAVKVIIVTGADAEARDRVRARFHREARAAAALPHHPNVVPVYDYGTDDALDLDYLVMEMLRGEDLATRLARRGAPLLTHGMWILREAARGVAVGHRSGLVHRDVKPGNIFLADTGHDEVQVRVLDFGIAKAIAEEDTLTNLTQDGRAPHSPTYASPEQLRGLSKLTPASDVFSLGTVGFQMLTGERPFTEADRNRMSLGMAVPTPDLRGRNPAIPPPVEEVVRRALAYEPTERFADAAAFARALDDAMRGMADAPIAPYMPAPVARDHTAVVVPAPDGDRTEFMDDRTLLDPPAGAPVPVPVQRAHETAAPLPPPSRKAREPESRGTGGIVLWSIIGLLVVGALGAIGWFALNSGESVALDPAPDTLAIVTDTVDTAAVPDQLDAAIANQEGRRLYNEGRYGSALEQFERALEIVPANPEFRNNLAITLLQLGRARQAVQQLERVLGLDPDRTVAYVNLGDAQLALGDTSRAILAYERFLASNDDPGSRALVERKLRGLQFQPVPAGTPPPSIPRDTIALPPRPAPVGPAIRDPGPLPGDTVGPAIATPF